MLAMQYNDPMPLEIRAPHHHVDARLRDWVHERLGRHLGKFASQIERIDVRFGDENGPKGGFDRGCLVHVVLHSLPPIAVEIRGETDREAFDLAAGRAERATKHALQKAGFTTKRRRRRAGAAHGSTESAEPTTELAADGGDDVDEGSVYGRRVGRGQAQLEAALATPVDEDDVHTALRNTKRNTTGMAYDLEDSMTGRPSRKSTRPGKNRVKPANGLTLRTKSSIHSPAANAARAMRRG